MKVSLIIVTYNRPAALAIILKSVVNQSVYPDEIIIADDGSTKETQQLIESFQQKFPVPLLQVWHEDKGFRAAAIRNKAVKKSSGEYLIFSDGDLFFHPRFIEDFRRNIRKGEALIGSRVFLSESATKRRTRTKKKRFAVPFFSPEIENNRLNAVRLPFLNTLLKPLHFSSNLRGGLLGTWKKDVMAVNGWNEDFSGWGLEDTELVARLFNGGVTFRKIKFQAITYHLWHRVQSREQVLINQQLLEKTITGKFIKCKNGLTSSE
ncbi:glycosyltransferase [Mariniphaga sediminis]|jgi:glycosyltransferase involved in cell wall biosynthesis|uniref:Glycosyltransferase n=1 Tax=Mariniphaga sediminis TaxID=1628158 RepID=A0A399CVG8_9BACT|nr:glycosyltransferase family 2 protein [Mariniphaga sediminis]RIH63589.1 glycosyltransferase [Mariniphaga sediminis]